MEMAKQNHNLNLYEQIDIWRRLPDGNLRWYRCFRLVRSGRFCVQSADSVRVPVSAPVMQQLRNNYFELLSEIAPEERISTHATIEDAILAFDMEFGL